MTETPPTTPCKHDPTRNPQRGGVAVIVGLAAALDDLQN